MNLELFKRVLVLAPHTDDGELGCGGTILRLLEQGSEVYYVAFSTAEESVPIGFPKDILRKEVTEATQKLGIKRDNLIILNYSVRKFSYFRQEILEDMIKIRKQVNPDLVLMPCLNDVHQDHETISREGLRAFKRNTILGYELIWNNLTFNATSFVKLERRHIEQKHLALKEYKSQEFRDYFSENFVRSLATSRGVQIGSEFAEAFQVIRLVID